MMSVFFIKDRFQVGTHTLRDTSGFRRSEKADADMDLPLFQLGVHQPTPLVGAAFPKFFIPSVEMTRNHLVFLSHLLILLLLATWFVQHQR